MSVRVTLTHRAALLHMSRGEIIRFADFSGRSRFVRVVEIDWAACTVKVQPLGWLARAWLWLRGVR